SVGSSVGWSVWREQSEAFAAKKNQLAQANDELDKSQRELDRQKGGTLKEIRDIQDQIDALFGDWKQEENKTRRVLEKEGTQIILKGPQAPIAGANNAYEIELRNRQENVAKDVPNPKAIAPDPAPQLQMRVFNQRNNETIYQQDLKVQGFNN